MAMWANAGLGLLALQRGDNVLAHKQFTALRPSNGLFLPGLSVDNVLGMLASAIGLRDEAQSYFNSSLAVEPLHQLGQMRAWIFYDYADALLHWNGSSDWAKGRFLLDSALALAAGPTGPEGPAGSPGPASSSEQIEGAIREVLDEMAATATESPTSALGTSLPVRTEGAQRSENGLVKIGVASTGRGSHVMSILDTRRIKFDDITENLGLVSLSSYDLLILDQYPTLNLRGEAFQQFVQNGGVMLLTEVTTVEISNGDIYRYTNRFSKTWSPYILYLSGPTEREVTITRPNHPIFRGLSVSRFTEPFDFGKGDLWENPDCCGTLYWFGVVSFASLDDSWVVLLENSEGNAVLLEAQYGEGHFIVNTLHLGRYNEKPLPSIYADRLLDYAMLLAGD
ncbi:MAG: hypothetical protein BZY75_02125 [SAR202 cluster bacterium Io17-Chloro-G7]|nr:MAG: hypothetical protein BZY75_02125 [SAR202 cluster bacterium Io17-Chloro-G7]